MLELNGLEKLNERLRKVADAKWFEPFIKDLAQHVFDEVEQGLGRHSKNGLLERSLGAGPEKIGEAAYRVRSDGQIAPYNIFVELGSRPHTIEPNKRKALRWVGGNAFIFAKFVHHPGYRGDPVFATASSNALKNFDVIAQRHMKDI